MTKSLTSDYKSGLYYIKNTSVFITISILSITPLIFSDSVMYSFHTPKYLFLQLMLFLLLSVLLFKREFRIQWNVLDISILFRVFVLILFYFISSNYSNLFPNIDILFYLTLFYFLTQQLPVHNNNNDFNKFIFIVFNSLFVVSLIESIYGVLQYYGFDIFHSGGYKSYESNVVGTFGSANSMGGFLAAVLPFNIYLFIKQSEKVKKFVYVTGTMIVLWALVLTLSRGAWIALCCGLFFLFFPLIIKFWNSKLKVKINKYILIILILVIVVSALLGIFYINKDSALGRIFIWKVSREMIKDFSFFGVGYGNYGYKYLDYQAEFFSNPSNVKYYDKAVSIKDAHSEIIHVLAETGILGLIFFLLIFIIFFYTGFLITKSRSNKDQLLIKSFIASMLIITIHSMVDCVLHSLPITLIFYFILAVISLKIKKTDIPYESFNKGINKKMVGIYRKTNIEFILRSNFIVSLLGILLLGINCYHIINKSLGYIHWKEGQNAVYSHNWEKGIEEYEKELKFLPDNGELQFHLGAAYSYTGRSKEAIKLLNQSLKDFSDKNIYITLGKAYFDLGRYDEAERSFKKATAMYPKLLLPHLWLAEMYYYKLGSTEKAISELKFIIEVCLLYTSPSPRDLSTSRMPSSA